MSRTDVHRPFRVQENDPYDRVHWVWRQSCPSTHRQRIGFDRQTRTWVGSIFYECDLHLGRDRRGPRRGLRCVRTSLRRTCGDRWCGGYYTNRAERRRDRHDTKRALRGWIGE